LLQADLLELKANPDGARHVIESGSNRAVDPPFWSGKETLRVGDVMIAGLTGQVRALISERGPGKRSRTIGGG